MLNKLGFPTISELSEAQLRELIANDRVRRVTTRAAGRINRIAKDKTSPKIKLSPTLESVGLAPALIAKLRASGKSDEELITLMKSKGVI